FTGVYMRGLPVKGDFAKKNRLLLSGYLLAFRFFSIAIVFFRIAIRVIFIFRIFAFRIYADRSTAFIQDEFAFLVVGQALVFLVVHTVNLVDTGNFYATTMLPEIYFN